MKAHEIELWILRAMHDEPEIWFDQRGEALHDDLAWLAAEFLDVSLEDARKAAEKAVSRFFAERFTKKADFDHFSQDNYYRRGQFNVLLDIEPMTGELDEDARRRALQQLLYALQDETGLKISSFVDIYDEVAEEIEEVPEDVMEEDLEEDEFVEAAAEGDPNKATAEFVVYNKLGVSALGKLKRFMDDHLKGDLTPQLVLIDPVTKSKFRTTQYRIQYLFHYFIAGQPPNDWMRLKELVSQEDRGYAVLIRKAMYKNSESILRVRRGKMTFTEAEAQEVGEALGINWDEVEFTPKDLQAGMEVELEHGSKLGEDTNLTGDDPEATAMIAYAHLKEFPIYYEMLAKMEKEMESSKKKEGAVGDDVEADTKNLFLSLEKAQRELANGVHFFRELEPFLRTKGHTQSYLDMIGSPLEGAQQLLDEAVTEIVSLVDSLERRNRGL